MAPRLDTPLSRALLDAGSLDPAALEEAVQDQVIHGGALDTLLLERGAVSERVLAALLAQSWGTEPVPLEAFAKPAPEAVRALPERMALAMKICPYAVEGTAVHVLCASPLDRGLIQEVSALLLKALVPHVVPEVRLRQALERAYGTALDERYASLLAELNVPATARAQAPLSDMPDSSDPGAARFDLVEGLAQLAAQESRDGIARIATSFARKFLPFAAMVGVRGPPGGEMSCVGWLRSGPAEGVAFLNKPFHVASDCVLDGALRSPSPSIGKPAITQGNAALFGWLGRRRPRTFLVMPIVVAHRPVGALIADGGIRARDFGSLAELVSFAAGLGGAFEALLRQRHAQHPSLFPQPAIDDVGRARREERRQQFDIHTEVTAPIAPFESPAPPALELMPAPAPPQPAAAEPDVPAPPALEDVPAPPPLLEPVAGRPRPITMTTMPRMDLPLRDGTSPFARNYVVPRPEPPEPAQAPAPVVSQPVVHDLAGLSRIEAPSLLDERAFANVNDSTATAVWRGALEEAVERGHQGGTVSAEEQPRLFIDDEGWEDIRYDLDALGRAERSADDNVLAMPGAVEHAAGPAAVELELPVAELVDHLDALDDDTVARARRLLIERGAAAVPALSLRFPGRLRVDPFDPGENIHEAFRLGPLVDVLHALGAAGLDGAAPHLDSRYPAHRFAAVLLFALTPDARGIELLRARLHDQEPRVRQLAADALAPFVAHPRFETVLVHLRERMHSPLLEARRRAVQLLGVFRDVGAVPVLIALIDDSAGGKLPAALAEDTRQALRSITLQDFGVRARGWDKWWQKAKKRSRVDWLIEGLASEDREIRAVAHVELASLAGDDFGYRADDDKQRRQSAVAAFQGWWNEQQQQPQAS